MTTQWLAIKAILKELASSMTISRSVEGCPVLDRPQGDAFEHDKTRAPTDIGVKPIKLLHIARLGLLPLLRHAPCHYSSHLLEIAPPQE